MKRVLYLILFFVLYAINCLILFALVPILKTLSRVFILFYDEFKRLLVYAPQEVREVLKVYDRRGLMYNTNYLAKITLDVAKMELEKQVLYADWNTITAVNYLNSEKVLDESVFTSLKENVIVPNYSNLTTTDIGNLAYIAQNLIADAKTGWFANDCFNYLGGLRPNAHFYL